MSISALESEWEIVATSVKLFAPPLTWTSVATAPAWRLASRRMTWPREHGLVRNALIAEAALGEGDGVETGAQVEYAIFAGGTGLHDLLGAGAFVGDSDRGVRDGGPCGVLHGALDRGVRRLAIRGREQHRGDANERARRKGSAQ